MKHRLKKNFLPLIYACRDLRGGIRGFYVFLACLVLGVGAIASIQSLSRGLTESLHHDGRYILGGDIALRTIYEPATQEQIRFLHDKMGPITIVMETRAMARRMDKTQATLVELKAVDPFYPLYGKLEIVDEKGKIIKTPLQDLILPPPIGSDGIEKDEWGALVEKELLSRLHIRLGDWVNIGKQRFQIRGIISKEPDRIGNMRFSLAPRIMISGYTFNKTGLKKMGSQVYYDHKVLIPYVKNFADLKAAKKRIENAFPQATWKGRDFLTASPKMERTIQRLTLFLTLIGLTTLLIGGVGISNSVRSFLDSRLLNIATLKCLGSPDLFVFRVTMIQVLILATLGIGLGLVASIFISQGAGSLLTAKLAITDKVHIYPKALMLAAGFGYLTTLCFSLWPIGRAVKVSPTDLFRDLVAPTASRPSLNVVLWILISAQSLALMAILCSSNQNIVIFFLAGAVAAFSIFYAWSALMKFSIRRLKSIATPEIRMAVANIYRPGNISTSVILSLGLGLTVLVAVALVQFNFTRLIRDDLSVDAPSFFFLDIEPGQREDFKKMMAAEPSARGLVMMPSLRGRVISVNGKKAEEALINKGESWVINSDRGITYTGELPAYSRVVEGKWWDKNYSGSPIISIATNVAKAFDIGVGDEITVNILGTNITAKVANVREIDWASFTMNFAITFAPGLLEKIPSNSLATVIISPDREEDMQNVIANRFQNVTCVRVRDALEAAQTIVRAVGQAVGISAGVTLLAGILVLAGSIASARKRHLYDSIILKVLGATRIRILTTFLLEYAILGVLTVVISAVLGTVAAYGTLRFVMDMEWRFDWTALLGVTLLCLTITLIAGFLGTWRALQQKPAPYLRNQ
ncbi:MAG: FtsX-like permease family protein [Alphaproteobacteria bacterium]|nr:FtsX-like permease family protein [Alphaproteobacteria bacterium]